MKKKKMKKRKKQGFSLVELLATIAIIGILSILAISGVSRYVNGAQEEQNNQNLKTASMAAELYFQANKDMLPKRIGEEKVVYLTQLRESKFLKSDIKNDKGESCMTNSFVRVYKLDKQEYSYTTYLYCGEEEPPAVVRAPDMSVSFTFVDASGKKSTDGEFDSNKIKDAYFTFTINGGETDERHGSESVGVYSYEYSILVKGETGSFQEVFNSGTIKAGRKNVVTVKSDKISKYVDIAGFTQVKVVIDAVSEQGGTIHFESGSTEGQFKDQTPPSCSSRDMAPNENTWVNKQSAELSRRVTVGCQDNANESGCKRKQFTQTWPYDHSTTGRPSINYNYGARWSYIEIEDNAKTANKTKCYVRVNVDLQAPEVIVKVYKANANGTKGANVLNLSGGSFTVSDGGAVNSIMPSGQITSTQYNNLVGGWMNNANYPNGVYIEVEMKDNLYLYSYKWEVNAEGTDNMDVGDGSVEQDNSVSSSGVYNSTSYSDVTNDSELADAEHGTLSATVSGLRLYREGRRHGKLTVCDKAGNCTTIDIYADIDRTPPTCDVTSKIGSNDYDHNWTKESVVVSRTCNDGGSGCDADSRRAQDKTYPGTANGIYSITNGGAIGEGNSGKVKDNAGNETTCSASEKIQIDLEPPSCEVMPYIGRNEYRSIWTRNNVVVSRTCNDGRGSGCDTDSTRRQSKSYSGISDDVYIIDNGGAVDEGDSGTVRDNVGNETVCPANITIKIDHEAPTCNVVSEVGSNNYDHDWTKNSVVVSRTCNDGSGSGCNNASKAEQSNTYSGTADRLYSIENGGAVGEGNSGTVTDAVGNSTTCPAEEIIKIDRKAPTCTNRGDSTEWTKNSRTIYYGCNDDSGSGCLTAEGSIPFNSTTKTSTIPAYTIKDKVGNETSCPARVANVYVDTTEPICTNRGDSTDWTKGNRTIYYGCNDRTNESGCATAERNVPFTTTTQTATIASYTIKDNAGNETTCPARTANVYVDKCDGAKSSSDGACSKSCGPGTLTRTWTSNLSGLTCSSESVNCNLRSCCSSTKKTSNCTSWQWSTCTAACEGTKYQYRSCTTVSTYDETQTCGSEMEYQNQNTSCGGSCCGAISLTVSTNTRSDSELPWPCECGTHDNPRNDTGAMLNNRYRDHYTFDGCTTGFTGYMCYYNPGGDTSCSFSKKTYTNVGDHGVMPTRTGHYCFKTGHWYYIRSTEYTYAKVCNTVNGTTHCAEKDSYHDA